MYVSVWHDVEQGSDYGAGYVAGHGALNWF